MPYLSRYIKSVRSQFPRLKITQEEVPRVLGEKNDAICNYLSMPEVFADFLNGTIFDGRKEVSPDCK